MSQFILPDITDVIKLFPGARLLDLHAALARLFASSEFW